VGLHSDFGFTRLHVDAHDDRAVGAANLECHRGAQLRWLLARM
jgi:hypothetical protein